MEEGVGNAPTSAKPILFSGQVQPAYICLPSVSESSRPPTKRGLAGDTRSHCSNLSCSVAPHDFLGRASLRKI